MFSLDLRNITAPPPGLSISLTDSSYVFSSLQIEDIEKTDKEFQKLKQDYKNCSSCQNLLKICDEIYKQKIRALSCLAEMFQIIQKESHSKLLLEKEIKELKSENFAFNEKNNKKHKTAEELREKNKIIEDLISENRELNKNRILTQRIISDMQKEILQKSKNFEENCKVCAEKSQKFVNSSISEKKILEMQELVKKIPDKNGRELRISIHKQICEIETDFIELTANQENFERIKAKYLKLPYLLKPIFDLTKQYEKSVFEFKKILYD